MHSVIFTIEIAVSSDEDLFSAYLFANMIASVLTLSEHLSYLSYNDAWRWHTLPRLQQFYARTRTGIVHRRFLLPALQDFQFWRDSLFLTDSTSTQVTCEQVWSLITEKKHHVFSICSGSLLGNVVRLSGVEKICRGGWPR